MIETQTKIACPTLNIKLIEEVFCSLQNGFFAQAADALTRMANSEENSFLPSKALLQMATAAKEQQWDLLSGMFLEKEFIGPEGYFLWFSPFSIRRNGKVFRELTGIFGRTLKIDEISEFGLAKTLRPLQKNYVVPGEIIPVESYLCFGFTGDEQGEAFLVPNGWKFKNSKFGPAINDLRQQRERFLKIGEPAIRAMFDDDSANLLLDWTKDAESAYAVQSNEFQFHEYGHFTGIDLNEKIKNKAFLTPWYAAVEEWRADGVAFELARKILQPKEAASLIAANFCLRFGIDAQRAGGAELDSDVNAALILFDRLLESGAIKINKNFKMSIAASSIEDLLNLTYPSTVSALALTRSETLLNDPRGIWNLYGGVKISPITRTLFEVFVRNAALNINKQLK